MGLFNFSRKGATTAPVETLHKQLNIEYVPMLKDHKAVRLDWFLRISWPVPNNFDEFKLIRYQKIICDIADRLTGDHSKWFSICSLDSIMDMFNLTLNEQTKPIYNDLRCLHCVDIKHIPPHIVEQIPAMINAILTEGVSGSIVDGEVVPDDSEPLKLRSPL